MMPLGGSMQAVAGSTPTHGEKPVGNSFGNPGLSETDNAAGSFLEWVQKLMDRTASGDNGGQRFFDLLPCDPESDIPTRDQLQTLIVDAFNQAALPAGQGVVPTVDEQGLGNGPPMIPPGITHALSSQHHGGQFADQGFQRVMSLIQAVVAAKATSPAAGQLQPAGNDQSVQPPPPSDIFAGTGQMNAVPQTQENGFNPTVKEAPPINDPQTQENGFNPTVKEAARVNDPQTQENGFNPTAKEAARVNDPTIQDNLPALGVKNPAPKEGPSKEIKSSPFTGLLSGGDGQKPGTGQPVIEQRPSGLEIEKQASEPAPRSPHAVSGPTRDLESIVSALTDQKTASPEDETANSRGRERPSQTQRLEMAAETDLQKNHASDSIKAAAPENPRSQSAFVDTAKAMAADPSTPLADKQTAGQANLLGRAEASAVKTFQTTVMDQIVDKAAMRSIHGRSEIQIRLKPEFLGNVQMNIAAEKAQLVVRIVTDQPVVKEIIETHLHQLKTELQSQGLTIDKFEVMVNPDAHQQQSRDQFAQMFKNNSFRNGRRQPAEKDPEGLNRHVGDVFDDAPVNRDGVNYFA